MAWDIIIAQSRYVHYLPVHPTRLGDGKVPARFVPRLSPNFRINCHVSCLWPYKNQRLNCLYYGTLMGLFDFLGWDCVRRTTDPYFIGLCNMFQGVKFVRSSTELLSNSYLNKHKDVVKKNPGPLISIIDRNLPGVLLKVFWLLLRQRCSECYKTL